MAEAKTAIAELAVDSACLLGEGPTWDAPRQRLIWLDIVGQVLHELDDKGSHQTTDLDMRITCAVPDVDGGLVVASGHDVVGLDVTSGATEPIATLPSMGSDGTNDGRVDPWGRLWVGTVDRSGENRAGLYRVSRDGSVEMMRGDVALSNGIDWSPDRSHCFYVDSWSHRIAVISLNADGDPVDSETLAEVDVVPDGLTVDSDGCVWVALWDGGGVRRYTPDGRLDRIVDVPGGFVTSCAFGADTTLYITTARKGLDEDALAAQPHAGGLFAVDAGVTGRGYTAFGF